MGSAAPGNDPPVRRFLLVGLALAIAGCGGHGGTPAARRPFRVGAFEPSIRVQGPLPGRPVSVHTTREVVPQSVRELVATGSGRLRLPLYVGRSRHHRLCIGTTGRWECLHPVDAQPVFSFTLQGGHRDTRDFGSIVGLAAPDVRVTVDHLNHEVPLRLQRFPRFGWTAFASPLWRNGAPDALHFYDRSGHELSGFIDLAFEANPCPKGNDYCTPQGEWHSIGDPLEPTPLDERAKRISFSDKLVRSLLAGRRYSFDPAAGWSKCSGGTIGVILTFHIPSATFTEDWPSADYDANSHTAYVQHVTYFRSRV